MRTHFFSKTFWSLLFFIIAFQLWNSPLKAQQEPQQESTPAQPGEGGVPSEPSEPSLIPLPDLVIREVQTQAITARFVRVKVVIANTGNAAAFGPIWVGSRPSWYTKRGFNSAVRVLGRYQSLEASETLERIISLPSADDLAQLTVDPNNRVEEINEGDNNFYGAFVAP